MQKSKLWYISTNRLFQNLPKEEQDEMTSMLKPVNVKKRSFVYSAGDKSDTIYILKEGRIKISRLTEEGRELTLEILEPGDIFGELALAGEEEREASAEALEDSFICAIKRGDFEGFVSNNPMLSLSITKWIGWRLKRIENRFENLIFQDVRGRLLSTLRDLAGKYGEDMEKGRKIAIRLSHQELANLVGSTRETVTVELNNLKRTGDIIIEDRSFILPKKTLSLL